MKFVHSTLIGLLAATALISCFSCSSPRQFDLVIRNGEIIDGTGSAARKADIGITGNKITAISGDLSGAESTTVVDATGKTIVPGFIDIHSHAYDGLREIENESMAYRQARNLTSQGITTLITNQDGRQPYRTFNDKEAEVIGIAEQAALLQQQGTGPNVGLMVGHNTIRYEALKGEGVKRYATPAELDTMKQMINRGMEEGAFGLSAGLEYFPGRWSNTGEVVELVQTLEPYRGVYIVHERSSGSDPMWFDPSQEYVARKTTMLQNVEEVIQVARACPEVNVSATHIKVKGADYWGKSKQMKAMFTKARNDGLNNLYVDQYPYNTTGSDGNTVLFPAWAYEQETTNPIRGYAASGRTNYKVLLQATLEIPGNEEKLRMDVKREIERRGGLENLLILNHPDSTYIGQTLALLTDQLNMTGYELALHLQMNGNPYKRGGARMRGFSLSEDDVAVFASMPFTMTASDAGITDAAENRPVHPRYFGTFPRKIRRYAMEQEVLSVEEAIHTATGLPAEFLHITDRGLLKEGYIADIAILDLKSITDKAVASNPNQYSEGVTHVIVNGQFLVRNSAFTDALPGKVLKHPSLNE